MLINLVKSFWRDTVRVIKNGFIQILSGNILVKMIAFLSSMVIVRLVDKAAYANLTYANNLYSYLGLLSGLGMPLAMIRYCTAAKSREKDKAYFLFGLKAGGAFELALALILCITVCFIDLPFPKARFYTLLLGLTTFLSFLVTMLQSYNRAHLDYNAHAKIGVVNAATVCVASIIFVYLFGVVGSVIGRYVSLIISILFCWFVTRKKFPSDAKADRLTGQEKKEYIGLGFTLMLSNFFSSVMPINESFLVNNIIQDEIVTANFKVAGMIPEQLLLFSGAITVYFFPIFAGMSDPKKILRKSVKVGVGTAVLIFSIAAAGMATSPLVIQLIYGSKYADAIPVSYLLWFMRALNAGVRVVPLNILSAIGHHKFNAKLSGISCIVHVVLDYFFIKTMGILGVAYVTTFIYLITGIVAWIYLVYVCKHNKIGKRVGDKA